MNNPFVKHVQFYMANICFVVIISSAGLGIAQTKYEIDEQQDGIYKKNGDALAGQRIAEQLCSGCHSIKSEGKSPFAPAPPFRDIVQKYPPENLAEALSEGIVVGHDAMPEFQFGPEVLSDFLAFLDALKVD